MEKIKLFLQSEKGKDVLVVIIVILVGLGSFVLGRLSTTQTDQTSTNAENESQNNGQDAGVISSISNVGLAQSGGIPTSQNSSSKPFFASSKGKKYYPADCSGGKNIKQANRIYFDTAAQAEAAGYTLSSSCK